MSNFSAVAGGATYRCGLNDCLLVGNIAAIGGAAAWGCSSNCTIFANSATNSAGGAYLSTNKNCIVYFNEAPTNANYSGGTLDYCCTCPLPTSGLNNITNPPSLSDPSSGDVRLKADSPCINSGCNRLTPLGPDLGQNIRIVFATVDIGAYEFQYPSSAISYAWLQQYGLPTDGSEDFADPDGDGMNNWQEWIAGTAPTDSSSVFKLCAPVHTNNPIGLYVSWQSVSNRAYFLQRSTNLSADPAFSSIKSNILGQAGTTSFADTNAIGVGPYFYRVGVQR